MNAQNQSGKERVVILGATGSIGRSTLDVIARHPDRFEVLALTAQTSAEALALQCREHRARYAVIGDAQLAGVLRSRLDALGCNAHVLAGEEGLRVVSSLPEADCVMAAIVGAAGLGPTLAAAQAGKKILLANKEAIVMAGPVFMAAVERSASLLLPIDSEHNAVFQCLPPASMRSLAGKGVRRILLTASGGPFRTHDRAALAHVTPEEACAHPVWSMGPKISVDSATMMNKGLEVIEAHWLFGAEADAIEVVIHPQSVIHSMVEYVDGSVIAQMGNPDMRTPIAQALGYPERMEAGVPPLDLFRIGTLAFEAPDSQRFPALRLAYQALRAGGSAPTILNAANEVAVEAFLTHKLTFLGITEIIEETLGAVPAMPLRALDDVMDADQRAREHASTLVGRRSLVIA